MSFKDFKIIETIGKGSFASVYKVVRRSDNKMYALKRVKINKMSKKEIADALNEIRFLASIRHKNVVGFLEAFLENNETELCIVMEYCGSGDLAQKVERYKKKRQYIDEKVIWRYMIQALKALSHLHGKGICHRDLKVANTFLAEDGSIKIGDMNVSKRLEQGQLKTQIGTPYYMSPEIWNNKPYDSRSDIWSLGCMMYELAALRPPFLGDSFPSLKRAVTLGRYASLPSKYSDGLSRVIGQMLKLDSRSRPSADMLLKSSDVLPMMQLDETSTSFGQANPAANQPLSLINTIKVPQHLRKLNSALPKPCYPDVRPNSPTSWTVAEQKAQHAQLLQENLRAAHRRPIAPLPPVPTLPLPSMTEASVAANGKENHCPVPTHRSDSSDPGRKHSKKHVGFVPGPPPSSVAPSAVVADYYSRRPLAPAYPLHPSNRANVPPHRAAGSTDSQDAPYKVPGMGYNRPVSFKPSMRPTGEGAENAPMPPAPPSIPAVSYEKHQQYAHQPRAPPARLQYHHNRVW